MRTFEGKLTAEGVKVGIVAARFNEFIVSKLLSGCEDGLLRHGVQGEDIDVAWVPGAFESPLIAAKMAGSGKYDAVIALGAVFVFLFKPAGYVLSSFLLCMVIMYMIGKRNWVQMVLVSLLVPLVMWAVFYKLLTVNIPMGPLDFLCTLMDKI